MTITKSITIDGGGGQVASVLVAGTNGIVVQAGPSDVVILRNLRLNGLRNSGNGGLSGIRFLAGASLIVDKCEIFGFNNNGVDVAMGTSGQVWVTNTNIQNVGGTGVAATTTAGVVTVGIDQLRVELSNKGVESGNHSRVTFGLGRSHALSFVSSFRVCYETSRIGESPVSNPSIPI